MALDLSELAPFIQHLLRQPNEASARRMMGSLGIGATTDAVPEGSTNLYFTNARAQAAVNGLLPTSGLYTPAVSATANVAASAPSQAMWTRIGNIVTVSGEINITPSAANLATALDLSLPVFSDLTGVAQLNGTAATDGVAGYSARMLGDVTPNTATLRFACGANIALQGWSYQFQYQVA